MKKNIMKKSSPELVSALLYILVGVLLVIFKSHSINWVMTAVGVLFIVSGVLHVLKNRWSLGTFNLVIGASILVLGWVVKDIVIPILGILIALKGVLALISYLRAFRKSWLDILFAVLTVLVGLLLAFGNLLDLIIVIAGVALMFNGVIALLASATQRP